MLFLKHCNFACPGDEGHLPVAPLPPPPAPHLGLPLALLPIHAEPGVEEGGEMGIVHEADHGRDGVPDLTPEAEEGMEEVDPGEGVTGHDQGPMIETGSERGSEKETDDDTLHADGQGTRTSWPPSMLQSLFYNTYFIETFPVVSGLGPAHGRGAVLGEGVGAVEATGEETAAAAAPQDPPVV